MSANLTQPYLEAEQRFKAAVEVNDKIAALEEMISELPKHKGTEKLHADLKTRLAKLKKGAEGGKKGGPARRVTEYEVIEREGAGQIALIGAPNTGKSALLCSLTNATSEVTDYPFTTRKPVPGAMRFEDVRFQIVDTPSLAPEFIDPFLPQFIRTADAAVLCIDLSSPDCLDQFDQVARCLEPSRIQLVRGLVSTTPKSVSPRPLPTLIAATKADAPDAPAALELLDETLGDKVPRVLVSIHQPETLSAFARACFDMFGIVRVYSKAPGKDADFSAPFTLPRGATVLEFAQRVHKDFISRFGYARVWGTGKYDGQRVARDYPCEDKDVIELHMA